MNAKHWLIVALIIIGTLYVFHMWNTHGSFSQFKSGIGVNR